MQGANLNKLVLGVVIVLVALVAFLNILSTRGNAIGELYFYVMILSGVIGLLAPRTAFFYLLFLTAYLDFFKRLMVFGQRVSLLDLYWALGIAPATMSGILVSVLFSSFQGAYPLYKGQHKWNFTVCGLILVGLLATIFAGGFRGYRQLGDAVNMVLYMGMLIVVPLLFRTPMELAKLVKSIILIFVPSAIYMWHHGLFGVRDWEIDYLRLGLSQEIRMLYERFFRPFGTLNSAVSASIIFGIFSMIALFGPWKLKDESGEQLSGGGLIMRIVVFPLFLIACVFTFTRTGWAVGLAALFGMICFRSRIFTKIAYLVGGAAVCFVIFGAGWLLEIKAMERLTLTFYDLVPLTDKTMKSFSFGTFNSRLISFRELTSNKDLWTPFGFRLAGKPTELDAIIQATGARIHDALTDTLIKFGYVPLAILALVGIWLLIKMHSNIFWQRSPLAKNLALISTTAVLSFALGGLSSWTQFYTFPINTYMWLFAGITVSLYFYERGQMNTAKSESKNEPAEALTWTASKSVVR